MLGFSQNTAILIFLAAVAGSFFNIPLGKTKMVAVERPYFFGLFKKTYAAAQGISINVGGAVVPAAVAGYVLLRIPFWPAFAATLLTAAAAKLFSRYVPSKGVVLSPFFAVAFSALFAFLLTPHFLAQTTFAAGVLGVIAGADILNIPAILKKGESGVLSIGGAGVFDAIFLIGVLSALLSLL